MIKYILSVFFCTVFFMCLPMETQAHQEVSIVDKDFTSITITLLGSVLKITGANGQQLQIYNVAGVRVMNVKVDGDERDYGLSLPKGCYIVKVGKVVRKISVL